MSGGEGGRGLLGAIASENFLVPLLTGLGAMASSPSRYLGSAILQGLGAGATAYENVQTKAAERAKIYADIVSKAYNPDINAVMVYDEDGRTVPIPIGEFYKGIRAGKRYNLAPNNRFAPQSSVPSVSIPSAPQAPQAPQQAAATRIIPPGGPLWSGLTQEQYDRARSVAERLESTPRVMRLETFTPEMTAVMSPYASIQETANLANQMTYSTLKFVGALADLGNKDLTGSAAMAARPAAEFYNSLVGAIGLGQLKIMEDELGKMEAIDKAQINLATRLAETSGQKSAQSLQQFTIANPGNLNSPEGRAQIAVDRLIQNQRAKDLQNYANNFKNAVREFTSGNETIANLSGENLENEFSNSETARYQREAESLRTMMRLPFTDPETKKETTLMSYVINNFDKLSEADKKGIEEIYGAGITRYFR